MILTLLNKPNFNFSEANIHIRFLGAVLIDCVGNKGIISHVLSSSINISKDILDSESVNKIINFNFLEKIKISYLTSFTGSNKKN